MKQHAVKSTEPHNDLNVKFVTTKPKTSEFLDRNQFYDNVITNVHHVLAEKKRKN